MVLEITNLLCDSVASKIFSSRQSVRSLCSSVNNRQTASTDMKSVRRRFECSFDVRAVEDLGIGGSEHTANASPPSKISSIDTTNNSCPTHIRVKSSSGSDKLFSMFDTTQPSNPSCLPVLVLQFNVAIPCHYKSDSAAGNVFKSAVVLGDFDLAEIRNLSVQPVIRQWYKFYRDITFLLISSLPALQGRH